VESQINPGPGLPAPARLTTNGTTPGTSHSKLTLDRSTLEKLLQSAASAARIAGSIEDPAIDPPTDDIDAIVHELSELLGNPDLLAAPVPSARSSFALNVVSQDGAPELVAPDALRASRMRTLITDDSMRHEFAGAPEPSELGFAFTDDTVTQPHVRQLRPTHGPQCQRVVRLGDRRTVARAGASRRRSRRAPPRRCPPDGSDPRLPPH
jgi:hypothetical protein